MAKRKRSTRQQQRTQPDRRRTVWLPVAVAGIALVAVAAVVLSQATRKPGQVAWSRLGTEDVHSLTLFADDTQRLLFGHHGGVKESRDGGRTWAALAVRQDAMSLNRATDGSLVIAGHDVFSSSTDGGATWSPIPADLPNLDIHGFARDPGDPATMWAYLATGGLWRSSDGGINWEEVRAEGVAFPLAFNDGALTTVLAIDATGLVASTDGGRTFATRGQPPAHPMTSLAATPDGRTIYAGSPNGLFRSDDAGRTWSTTAYVGSALAVATSPDGAIVALVSRQTDFFRSTDRGATWPGP